MIRVCDAIMGSGKSSAAITYMNEHPDERYIYITPYLEEAKRIKKSCPSRHFVEPKKGIEQYGFTKVGHTIKLLEKGRNVATTHQAFMYYTQETLDVIRRQKYTLFIDESVNALANAEYSRADIEILEAAEYIRREGDHYVIIRNDYEGELYAELFRLMKSRELTYEYGTASDEVHFYWSLPAELLDCFENIYVMTYMAEAQDICHYMRLHDMPFTNIGIDYTDGVYRFSDTGTYVPPYVRNLRNMIHIYGEDNLNSIGDDDTALSMSWFSRNKDNGVKKLRNNILNYFNNQHRGVIASPASQRMWSTYASFESKLGAKGYKNSFLTFNKKSENDHRDCNKLVYAVNLYINVGRKLYYEKHGVKISNDAYALSNMIQWIWRSAIRDGKEIWIYIPSRRMRDLLTDWMDKLAAMPVASE